MRLLGNIGASLRRLIGRSPAAPPRDDGPSWCLVGNIVDHHPFGESGDTRTGTKHFTPGTTVYCLPPQWGDGYESVVAVGVARGSRRLITVDVGGNRTLL